ncbi:hypothetical protein BDZ97DRAFT_238499 [Flammula alnicola]|nr:hypothetical protein BDZ97DRAFT_238499 [Flammula alnicola]
MSIGRPKPNALIPPGEYQANQAKIEQAREYLNSLEEMNQTGLQRFTERERANQLQLEVMKRDLQKKVDEGIQAQLLMQELERRQLTSLPLLEGGHDSTPGSARIEEVHTTDYTRPNFSQKDRHTNLLREIHNTLRPYIKINPHNSNINSLFQATRLNGNPTNSSILPRILTSGG